MADIKESIDIDGGVSSKLLRDVETLKSTVADAGLAVDNLKAKIKELSDAKNLVTAQSRLEGATARLRNEQARSATASVNLERANARMRAEQNRTEISSVRLAQAQAKLTSEYHRQERAQIQAANARQRSVASINSQASATNSLTGSVGNLAAQYLTLRTAYQAAATAMSQRDEFVTLQNKLTPLTKSAEAAIPLIKELRDVSNATNTPLDASVQLYARLSRALASIGRPAEEAIGLTSTINRLMAASGTTGGEAGSALLQLSQAFNKGKLDGDEFRTVMELMPAVADAIAKELGVTRGELLKLAPEGKITADVMVEAFKNAEATLGEIPKPIDTIDAAMTRVHNSTVVFFGELERGNGIMGSITDKMAEFARAVDYISDKMGEGNAKQAKRAQRDAEVRRRLNASGDISDDDLRDMPGYARARIDVEYEFDKKERDAIAKSSKKATDDELDARRKALEAKYKAKEDFYDDMAIKYGKAAHMSLDDQVDAQVAQLQKNASKKGITFDDEELKSIRAIVRADELAKQPKGKKDPAETRAQFLERVNFELDREIDRSGQLRQEREVMARFDSIEARALGKKITLEEDERRAIYGKIEAAEEVQRLQTGIDKVYDEARKPLLEYNLALSSNAQALADGFINQSQHDRNVRMARENYQRATNTLYDFNKSLSDEEKLIRMSARDREIESQIMQLRNDQLSKGIILEKSFEDALRNRLKANRDASELQAAEDAILDASVNKWREFNVQMQAFANKRGEMNRGDEATFTYSMVAEIGQGTQLEWDMLAQKSADTYHIVDELRKQDMISEQEASAFRIRIWQIEQNAKLSTAQQFFGAFEGMQRSNWSEMATVGKAAAIANAVISTYQAANAAYASQAGIPVVGPALGAAAAAGAVLSGLANVEAIRSQPTGFRDGGYTGAGGVNDVAGVVHGREYVMDANTTSRVGRKNLDALRKGDAEISGGGSNVTVPLTVVLVSSNAEAEEFLKSAKGEKIIVSAVNKNSGPISKMLRAQ